MSPAIFIFDIAKASDKVDRAAKEFREVSVFLHGLNATLKPLESYPALGKSIKMRSNGR